jgi:hypothetical protein
MAFRALNEEGSISQSAEAAAWMDKTPARPSRGTRIFVAFMLFENRELYGSSLGICQICDSSASEIPFGCEDASGRQSSPAK